MISVDNIGISFGNFDLLSDISFQINRRERIGLTGKNGAGKTTLLRIIHGIQKAGSGQVSKAEGAQSGYLPQQMKVADNTSVFAETLTAFSYLSKIENKIALITADIEGRNDYDSASYLKLCDKLSDLQHELKIKGGDNYISETEQALFGLGFERKDFEKATSQLSGGWRMRIELAKLLLGKPELLLLDEPTNHLDILSIQWLENYLSSYPGALILVSHDRTFLDTVTNRTIELSLGKAFDYKVPYSEYLELRKERRDQQLAAYRNQQKMISDNERFIERFRYKNTKAVQVQSRVKMLNRLDRIEIDEEDNSAINIRFAPAPRSGTIVIETENLSKSYGSHEVLKDIDFIVERGEKVAFVGRNGEGKTTFSKIIMNELDYSGKFKLGHNINIGYFAQNQDEILNDKLTVFQTIDNITTGDIRTRIRGILGAFLFSGDDIDKKVSVLSGGERSRLALIKLLLEPYNLLVLDEPTNHLDMQSKDILKQALLKYDGTLIVVSHDRDFLDGLTDKVYEFRDKKIRENNGGIYDFLKNRNKEAQTKAKEKEIKASKPGSKSDNKKKYLKRKEEDKKLRKLSKDLQNIEEKIESIETRREELDTILSGKVDAGEQVPDNVFSEYEKLSKELEYKMREWERISMELEKHS